MTNLIDVDKGKCVGDGICAEVCPIGIIRMDEGTPEPVAGAGNFCLECGHCVAFCPTGALSHRAMKSEECAPMRKELGIDPGEDDARLSEVPVPENPTPEGARHRMAVRGE